MKTNEILLVFFCTFISSSAHLCMISPPQRGSMMGLNKKASDDCILLDPPCGNRKPSDSPLKLAAGSDFTVTFQKNLDHWLETTPGQFEVALLQGTNETLLTKIPDGGEPSLTLYSVNVTMPQSPTDTSLVLKMTYVTKNPEAPPVFYQCSDIELYGKK